MPAFEVLTNQRLTTSTQLLTLQNQNPGQTFHFEAGQYAAISFRWHGRPTTVRCFSIVSPPTDNNILQLGIQIKGHYTKALSSLEQGEIVNVHGAFGNFKVNNSRDKDIVLLAGGIGITPFMSIIRYLTRLREEIKITLVYCCRNEHDVPFADELIDTEQRHRNFQVIFIISNGLKSRFAGKKASIGHVTANIMDIVTRRLYLNKTFFICGSPGFMQAMTNILRKKGTPPNKVITESFELSSGSSITGGRNWPHTIYGLTSAALLIGLLIVMFTDFAHTMPTLSFNPSAPFSTPEAVKVPEAELNSRVNNLPGGDLGKSTLVSAQQRRL